jgi:hypothetical protein
MTDRHRSQDKSRDSERVHGEPGAPSGQGRAGGRLPRDVGSRDEKKRATERPAGATRVRKSDERDDEEE